MKKFKKLSTHLKDPFQSSGDIYFRRYSYRAHYFTQETVNYQGSELPFKAVLAMWK